MLKKTILHLSLAAAMMTTAAIASAAGSASTNVGVSATVAQSCSIGSPVAIAFGAYDPVGTNATTALNATGSFSVTCSKGASGLTVGIGAGLSPVGAQRQMKGTLLGLLNYNLTQPPTNAAGAVCTFPGTVPWTETGAGLLTLTAAPSKVARVYNVCGTIPAGQDVIVDPSYADTVSVTLNF